MLKRISVILLLSVFFSVRVCALSENDISAECAVLISEQTGTVLFAKNEHKSHSMASTTKIMTSIIAVESGKLLNEITVTDKMVNVEGTSMGLVAGDSISLHELVYGMLLPSGNDAANAAAVYLAGSTNDFSKLMNKKAAEIGMNHTSFVTASGLDNENHFSTAYDMALLGRYAVNNPEFLKVCSSVKANLSYGNPPYDRFLTNHNRLLREYDGCLGIKTGFTKKSGRCLVSYAKRNGTGLIAVTLNDPDDWNDHRKLFDYGFEVVSSETVEFDIPESVSVVGGIKDSVCIAAENFCLENTNKNISFVYCIPRFLYAPVKAGQIIGNIIIYLDSEVIGRVPVTATENTDYKKFKTESKSLSDKIKEYFYD